ALKGEPLTIYGDGSQSRSFCYVDDLIKALVAFMESDATLTGPINLGNPEEFTMIELANLIIDITASKSELIFLPLPEDDPKQRQPDITLAKERLNWKPVVPLREGLLHTITYFEKLLSGGSDERVLSLRPRRLSASA